VVDRFRQDLPLGNFSRSITTAFTSRTTSGNRPDGDPPVLALPNGLAKSLLIENLGSIPATRSPENQLETSGPRNPGRARADSAFSIML